MSAESEQQRRVYDFFLQKYNEQQTFTKDELATSAGWDPDKATFKTYWSKQFRPLLVPHGSVFRVSQYFKRFATWEKFRTNVLTQNRSISPGYKPLSHEKVVVFEFFMPLRNEEYLRDALDSLFYKDFIISKLKLFALDELVEQFPQVEGEDTDLYLTRVCEWISKTFVGYSINHVRGRYKVGELKSKKQAFETILTGEPYLIDETTAVTTFVIPCGDPKENLFLSGADQETELLDTFDWDAEAKRIRWFFCQLFVQSIIEVVNGEDEIWLLERGLSNQLHIWKRVQSDEGK